MKYIIFDKETFIWKMVYCNNHKPEGEELKDIAEAMVSYKYCGKFSSSDAICMNGGKLKNDNGIFIMSENGEKISLATWKQCYRYGKFYCSTSVLCKKNRNDCINLFFTFCRYIFVITYNRLYVFIVI